MRRAKRSRNSMGVHSKTGAVPGAPLLGAGSGSYPPQRAVGRVRLGKLYGRVSPAILEGVANAVLNAVGIGFSSK